MKAFKYILLFVFSVLLKPSFVLAEPMMQPGSNFRTKFGTNWETKLGEFISVNSDLRCTTCFHANGSPSGRANIPQFHIVMENLEHMCNYNIPGTNTVINALKNPLTGARDGVNFMIGKIRSNPTKYNGITAFEYSYSDIYNNTADAMIGSRKLEFKSWTPNIPNPWNSFFSGTGNTYTQFKRYLEHSNSLDDLEYIFNLSKAGDITTVKNAFKDLFSGSKSNEIFNTIWDNQALRNSLLTETDKIEAFAEFEILINNTNSVLYSFIK